MKFYTFCCGLLLLCSLQGAAQQSSPQKKDLSGKVINEQSEPLAGANISLKSGRGTVTNAKGLFILKDVSTDDAIQISYIGYARQTIPVKDRTDFNITLKLANNELDKVVVQAYGTTSKRLATGNIGTVSAEEISKHPVMNPIRILQGLVPGAVITNPNGAASSSVKIEIRGRNTINPDMPSEPLFIVDGVPMTILNVAGERVKQYVNGSILSQGVIQSGIASGAGSGQSPFFGINPEDIESIEVLKDADATAIYGSRAANGAILITTKKGKAGKTKAELKFYTGYNQVPRYYPLLNTKQYVEMRREALMNDGQPINEQTAPDLVLWDTTRYTDWQKYVYGGTGRRTSIQTNLSGGDIRTSFRAGVGYDYTRDVTTIKGGNYRGSFSLNLNHKSANQRLGFSWSSFYTITGIDPVNRPGSVLLPPNAPAVFDDAGNLNFKGWGAPIVYYPFGSLLETYNSKTNFLNNNIRLSYELIKGLVISTSFGYNNSRNDQERKIPIASQDPSLNSTGSLYIGHSYFRNLIAEPQIEYSSFFGKNRLTFLVGGTAQSNKTDGATISGINYTNDLLLATINSAPGKILEAFNSEYKYAGIFGRINYNRANKYLLSLNARRDGSSRFGPGRQFGNFGSVGGAWIFTEEPWIKKMPILSFGKLRASYGITGSDQIVDYGFLSRWQFGAYSGSSGTYNARIPITPMGFSDSLLHWEVNRKLEVSLMLAFLNDKISMELSWYRNRSDNQLVTFPTPAFTGFTLVTATNSPANVQNTGMEIIVNGKLVDNNTIKLSLKGNLAINRNKLLAYPNLDQSPYKNRFVIGKSLNFRRSIHYTGIDPQTGLYTFKDVNRDGNIILGEDDIFLEDMFPKFDGGFTTDFSYRKLALSIFFYFRKQTGYNYLASSSYPGSMSNQSTEVLRRWQKPGDITDIGKYTTLSTANSNLYYGYSDAIVTNASFIRLQNLSLSYEMPDRFKTKTGIGNLKVYVQAENLFVITSYRGIDPEAQVLGVMPPLRTVSAGLSCNF